jgi:hypothetical protein
MLPNRGGYDSETDLIGDSDAPPRRASIISVNPTAPAKPWMPGTEHEAWQSMFGYVLS